MMKNNDLTLNYILLENFIIPFFEGRMGLNPGVLDDILNGKELSDEVLEIIEKKLELSHGYFKRLKEEIKRYE